MTSTETVELDFFGMERQRDSSSSSSSNKSQFHKFLHRHRSFQGLQHAMSKIKPQILKSLVIASNGPNARGSSPSEIMNVVEATPLTIFYNGSVSVFNVPRHKAESILKIAVRGSSSSSSSSNSNKTQAQLIDSLDGDLPIARRKSLQRFLEKRKERLTSVSPYGN